MLDSMKKVTAVLILLFGLSFSGVALADKPGQEVCAPLDSGKIDTTGDPLSVTVSAPDGKLISSYCVKAGSDQSVEDGAVRYFPVEPPVKTLTIVHPSGKAVSHWSVEYVEEPTSTTNLPGTTSTQPSTSSTEETTTSTSAPAPTTTVNDPTTISSPTTSTPPQGTTPTPGTGSTPPSTPELPQTGANLWTVLIAAGMVLGGLALTATARRRA